MRVYIRDIWCPLSVAVWLQFIQIRASFVCTYLKKRRDPTPSTPLSAHLLALSQSLPPPSSYRYRGCSNPLSFPCPFVSRGRAPFRNLPMAKGRLEDCVWPRIRDSYLLTESSRKGVIERRYRSRMSSAQLLRVCEAFMHPAAYGSIHDEIFCRFNFFLSSSLHRFLALLLVTLM